MPLSTELRRGLRTLVRSPGFFAVATLTLALGIGSTAALFSVTESVLWRPLPFPDSGRLALLSEHNARSSQTGSPVSAANFLDWRARSRSFENLGAVSYDSQSHTLTGAGERVRSMAVSAGFFETLSVGPALGRAFRRDEESSHPDVVLLTDEFWRLHFRAARDVLGQSLALDRRSYTIVGVLPAGFHLDSVLDAADPQVYVPLDISAADAQRASRDLAVIARIRAGISAAAASEEMNSLAARRAAEHPADNAGWDVRIENLRESFTKYNRTVLYLFLGGAILVLLIACANVAGLQLVRAVGRQREYAVRAALGARRATLLREALAETAWIALPGAVIGSLLGAWGLAGLRAAMPPDALARSGQIAMDPPVLAIVLAIAVSIAFVIAAAPVLLTRHMDLETALREGSKSVSAAPGAQRRINAIIAAEMALSFVLLFAAGLFMASHSRLKQVSLGFDPHQVLTLRITAGGAAGSTPADRRAFFGEVTRRASLAGGIRRPQDVVLASAMPLDGGSWVPYTVSPQTSPHGEEPKSLVRIVTPGYFDVLHIALLAGRAFSAADSESAPRVAIVNENLARSAFSGQNPVGRTLTIMTGGDSSIPPGPVEIVGLMSNTRELGLDEVPFSDVYLPFAQNPRRTMTLAVRTGAGTAEFSARLRKQLQSLDPDSALYHPETLDDALASQFRGERFHMLLVSFFAGLAVLLAAVGIYGAIAFSVSQRTGEFGLRMALGALPGNIRRLTLERTTRLTLAGTGCGLAVSLVLGQLLKSALYMAPHEHTGLIFGVGIRDPLSLVGAAAIVLALAALASLAPAMRAARVNPLAALRDE